MDSTPEMNCPKCGARQPESDTCVSCHIIISKYLERQQETSMAPPPGETYGGGGSYAPPAYGGARATTPKSGGLASLLPLIVLLALGGGGGWFVWDKGYFASKEGIYNLETGLYVNKRHNFKIELPPDLNIYDHKKYWPAAYSKNILFFATTGDINDTTVLVETCTCYQEILDSKQWEEIDPDMLAGSTRETIHGRYKEINGIDGYWYTARWRGSFKYTTKDFNKTIASGSTEEKYIFKTDGGKMLQIIIYVHPKEPKLLKTMRKSLKTLEKI